jgi:hypothetical protein
MPTEGRYLEFQGCFAFRRPYHASRWHLSLRAVAATPSKICARIWTHAPIHRCCRTIDGNDREVSHLCDKSLPDEFEKDPDRPT